MKKKLLLLIPAFVLSAAMCAGITACIGDDDKQGGGQGGTQNGEQNGVTVTEVTKSEWNAAISATAFSNVKATMINGVYTNVIQIDGNILLEETSSIGYNYKCYYNIENSKYFEYEYNAATSKYTKTEISKSDYDDCSPEGLAKMLAEMLTYDNYTYADAKYTYSVSGMDITVKFGNKKLTEVSYTREDDGGTNSMTFENYGSVSLTLPAEKDIVDGGSSIVSGGEMSEEDWNAALSAENFARVSYTAGDGEHFTEMNIYDNVIRSASGEGETFLEKDGNNYYVYYFNHENGKFIKQTTDKEYFDACAGASLAERLSYMLVYENFTYEGGVYVADDGTEVFFDEGKLVCVTQNNQQMDFSYDVYPIQVPSGDMIDDGTGGDIGGDPSGGGDIGDDPEQYEKMSEKEWDALFSADNFTNVEFVIRTEAGYDRLTIDGDWSYTHFQSTVEDVPSIWAVYYQKDGDKYYRYNDKFSGYSKTEITEEEYNENHAAHVSQVFTSLIPAYSEFKVETPDMYKAEADGMTYFVTITEDGRLNGVDLHNDDVSISYGLSGYDETNFDKISAEQVVTPVTEEAWNNIFAPENFERSLIMLEVGGGNVTRYTFTENAIWVDVRSADDSDISDTVYTFEEGNYYRYESIAGVFGWKRYASTKEEFDGIKSPVLNTLKEYASPYNDYWVTYDGDAMYAEVDNVLNTLYFNDGVLTGLTGIVRGEGNAVFSATVYYGSDVWDPYIPENFEEA